MEIPLSFTIVTGVGTYVVSELADTYGGLPQRVVLATPGAIAWDSCDCGQFAQTITSVGSSITFPTPTNDIPVRGCGHPFEVVNVTLSLLRCIPGAGPGNTDIAPAPDKLLNAALILEEDRLVVRRALVCYLTSLRDEYRIHDFTVGTAVSVGPDGLCGGMEINYALGISNSAVCCQ